jgi:Matrixin
MVRIIVIGLLVSYFLLTNALGNTVAPAAVAAPAKPEFQRLRWKGKTIRIAVSSSVLRSNSNIKTDSDVIGAIRRSLQAWATVADVDLQIDYSDRQNVSTGGAAGDGISLITIAQTAENVLFFSKDAESSSAKTRIFFNRKGVITEADIVLNPFQQFSTDGTLGTFDLESTLTHEIGHLLGLRHSGVLGATMAESFARNGAMGMVDFSGRTLSESDAAAIRELYGATIESDNCCGFISGKLTTGGGRAAKEIQVWAEESSTGRVIAQTEISPDGTFRMGGLSDGEYSVYWKTKDSVALSSMGELGTATLENASSKVFNEKVVVRPSETTLQYIGLNSQLADYAIPLNRGRSYLLNLGGRNLDADSIKISFSTPYIRILQVPTKAQEFSEGVSGLTFLITVDPAIEGGQYSVFANLDNGAGTSLIGAINVE